MHAIPPCPACAQPHAYADRNVLACPDCGHEWSPTNEQPDALTATPVRDCNGNVLASGDTVTVIKDLKVKGSSVPLKQGTMIRGIRLVQDDPEHVEGNSDRIKGLVLKTCFLRKA